MIRFRRDLWKILPPGGNAAEIGVAEGYFSADMLSWPINFPIVYMVDRWRCVPNQKGDASNPQEWHDKNLNEARKRVVKYGARAQILRGSSISMAAAVPNRSLSLVYIDGDHTEEGVMADSVAWAPKVMRGGVMAYHDYLNPAYGVKTVVDKLARTFGLWVHIITEDKPEDAGAYFVASNVPPLC